MLTTPSVNALPPGLNEDDESGQRVWHREISREVELAADKLSVIADEHTDLTAGVSLTSDRTMIEAYVTHNSSEVVAIMENAVGANFNTIVRVVFVEKSMDNLLWAQSQILEALPDHSGILAVAPIIEHNGLMVTLESTPVGRDMVSAHHHVVDQTAEPVSSLERVLIDFTKRLEVPVELELGVDSSSAGTRAADSPRFYGGSEIARSTTRCSWAFPVRLNGKTYALTAGHCGTGKFSNPGTGAYFGTTYTTAWPTNARQYGDWQLIAGSRYQARLFSGNLASSASLPISRANTGSRANGTELCSSGKVTASLCRYTVVRFTHLSVC